MEDTTITQYSSIFENGHVPFGTALDYLESGKKIYRDSWNNKGVFVYHVPANKYPSLTDVAKNEFGEEVSYNAYLAIKNVNGTVSTWVPSINDVLAKDWYVV